MRPSDPRIRQTLNQISNQIESANLSTQASLFSFSQNYVSPCLSSFRFCLEASCQPCYACFTTREDQRRQHRGARRGRDNFGFDFYDDWDEEEENWGNDELDRLLMGSDEQPARRTGMSYGSATVGRKNLGKQKDGRSDPNIMPKSSVFGFLERLPWKIGGRRVRYRPSVADLQENVGHGNREAEEPLLEDSEESSVKRGRHTRNRSDTLNSRSTNNSLSSRSDLFPSEDEDDAVPLDDEFAMVLTRRNTGATSDDLSSKKSFNKKPARSRTSTKTVSSKDTKDSRKKRRSASMASGKTQELVSPSEGEAPSMIDLKHEEEQVRQEEEDEIKTKREAAQQLARERGLDEVTQAHLQQDDPPNDQTGSVKSVPADTDTTHPDFPGAVTIEPKPPDDQI